MTDSDTSGAESSRIRILDIAPEPPEDVIVAIALALDQAWPEPQPLGRERSLTGSSWRFASRPWLPPAIPRTRWGRT